MSLTHRIAFRNHHLAAALYRTTQIGLQFRNGHVAILVHGINLAILIEEHREVVDIAINFMMRPRTLGTVRDIHLQAMSVDIGEDIELSVVIADGRRPDTLSVSLLAIAEIEIIRIIKAVETIGRELPIYEILGMEHHQSRHTVHRSTCQIVILPYSDNIRIRKLIIKQRIGKGTITIICRPRLPFQSLCQNILGCRFFLRRSSQRTAQKSDATGCK